MSGYWIFIFGLVIGICCNLILRFLWGPHDGDHSEKICQAYHDGFAAGQSKPGSTLELGEGQ